MQFVIPSSDSKPLFEGGWSNPARAASIEARRRLAGAGKLDYAEYGSGGKRGHKGSSGSSEPATGGGGYQRPIPIKVSNVKQAIELILKGKVVELPNTRKVNTVILKLAKMARQAKKLGKDAPVYDLCQVSVKGSNIFCSERLRTKEHPEGIPRIKMPQMKGIARKGSAADKLSKDENGEVNGGELFATHLKSLGINTTKEKVQAASLKASQSELIGSKVAKMMTGKKDPGKTRILVSRDNYIVDGHHHWAAQIGRDSADNKLGNLKMRITRVDAPISEVLKIANAFTKGLGISPKAATRKK